MARHLAHELKNALSPLALALDNVETAVERPDTVARPVLARSLATARDQLASLDRLVGEFRDFARTPGLVFAPADALAVGRAAVASATQVHPATPFSLEETQPVGELSADAEQLRRALHNLLINAAEAAPGRPVVLAVGGGPGRDRWWVAVRDEGPGLPAEIAAHWGEPYHTTKAQGTGLGLTVALQVIEGHGGRLEARPRRGGGLEVFASLPRDPRPAPTEEEA
jgi:nitrogen fixation/metabolism regulation signal transduction histidine kinase